jgi:transposase-like protein
MINRFTHEIPDTPRWTHVIPFFALPPDVRRVLYTTNALESVHAQLREIIKTPWTLSGR